LSERRKIPRSDYAGSAPYVVYEYEDRRFDPDGPILKRWLFEFPDFNAQPWKDQMRKRLRILSEHKFLRVLQPIGILADDETSLTVAMERQGERLSAQLTPTGLNDPETAAVIVEHVAEGLAELHRLNVAHGDIRPETIEFDPVSKQAWIADSPWGPISHWSGGRSMRQGAANILPPEFDGRAQPPTTSADIFALGKLWQQLLTGSAADASASIDGAGRESSAALRGLLAKNPKRRPADGTAVIERLHANRRRNRIRNAAFSIALKTTALGALLALVYFVAVAPIQQGLSEVANVRGEIKSEVTKLTTKIGELLERNTKVDPEPKAVPKAEAGAKKGALSDREVTQLAKAQWALWANSPEKTWADVQDEHRRYEGPFQVKEQLQAWLADYGSFPKEPGNAGSWHIKRDSEFGLADYRTGRRIDVIVDGVLVSTPYDAALASASIPIDYKPGDNSIVIIKLYRGRSWNELYESLVAERTLRGPLPMWLLKNDGTVGTKTEGCKYVAIDFPGP
jgi:serine/threonine protein kinase